MQFIESDEDCLEINLQDYSFLSMKLYLNISVPYFIIDVISQNIAENNNNL